MSFTPRYSGARLFGPLIANLLTIIQRDDREALDWANGDGDLPEIANFNRWNQMTTVFPALFIEPKQVRTVEAEDGSHYRFEYELDLIVVIEGPDEDQLQIDVDRYALALFEILETASSADMFAGYQSLQGAWTITSLELGRFGPENTVNNFYNRAARLSLTAARIEVKTNG